MNALNQTSCQCFAVAINSLVSEYMSLSCDRVCFIPNLPHNFSETLAREDYLHEKCDSIRQVIDLWRGNQTTRDDNEVPLATRKRLSIPALFVISNQTE